MLLNQSHREINRDLRVKDTSTPYVTAREYRETTRSAYDTGRMYARIVAGAVLFVLGALMLVDALAQMT